jgi:DNA-directed RNA polymerase omega subunit
MTRITVEDCIDKVSSPYELVMVAKERSVQLNSDVKPTVDPDNDKNTVISLREIAEESIKTKDLREAAIYKLRKNIPRKEDNIEEDEIVGMILKIYTKAKFLKVVYQYFHLKELGKYQKKFNYLESKNMKM